MNKKLVFSISLVIVLLLFLGYRWGNQQFRYSNIEVNFATEETFSPPSQEVLNILSSSTFEYLDRGKQSYVFSSRDGKYVLKFFDAHCFRSGPFPLLFPVSAKRCARKLQSLAEGYHLAWVKDRDNTGLLYVQLAANTSDLFEITVKDRFGIEHLIDLAKVPFVVQERAIPTRSLVSLLLDQGKIVEVEKLFEQLVAMYITEYRRGLIDDDRNIMYNTGFVGEKPVRIDVGRLRYDEKIKDPSAYQENLERVFVGRVGSWLHRHYPQYEQDIKSIVNHGQGTVPKELTSHD
ncbi:MAG: hypothetical protein WCG42_04175 [Parachlamydiaceae bacterium]